jgi:thiamine biosynthesis lipoprotein
MTNWTDTSETARINRLASREVVILDPELNHVLRVASKVGAKSGGAFDISVEPLVRLWGFLDGKPRVPQQAEINQVLQLVGWDQLEYSSREATIKWQQPGTRIDLGGVAKGYGVDRVSKIILGSGQSDALINLSGNMMAMGSAPGKEGWLLGIMDPAQKEVSLGRVRLMNQAIATSGNYIQYIDGAEGKKYGHILDPRTGWPVEEVASATVITYSAVYADAWATAFVVLGLAEAKKIAAAHPELQVILIEQPTDAKQTIWVEKSLRESFSIQPALSSRLTVKFF